MLRIPTVKMRKGDRTIIVNHFDTLRFAKDGFVRADAEPKTKPAKLEPPVRPEPTEKVVTEAFAMGEAVTEEDAMEDGITEEAAMEEAAMGEAAMAPVTEDVTMKDGAAQE